MFWDLILLGLFIIWVIWFLVSRRRKLKREGILFLYKTKLGLKIIDKLGKKYKKLWSIMSYAIIALGYILMIFFTYYLVKGFYIYLRYGFQIAEVTEAFPVALLVPYFTKIFGWEQFFPTTLYFIYFIIVIAVVAIVHEGAHGIFARFYDIKIKSTGFGFLGPILAFFVEQDDKQMQKKSIFKQLTVLAAGVFANVITALIFFGLLFLLFTSAYAPYGVNTVGYAVSAVPTTALINAEITNETIRVEGENLTRIIADDKAYFVGEKFFEINFEEIKDQTYYLYQDQAAIKQEIKGIIVSINGKETRDLEELRNELDAHTIGEEISVEVEVDGEIIEYKIELGESYTEEGLTVLGVGIGPENPFDMFKIIEPFKQTGIVYRPKFCDELIRFFYYLFAWMILINLLVALFNMLPIAIFDGGRFFYLTVLAITRNKKFSEKVFKFVTIFLLLLVFAVLIFWIYMRLI